MTPRGGLISKQDSLNEGPFVSRDCDERRSSSSSPRTVPAVLNRRCCPVRAKSATRSNSRGATYHSSTPDSARIRQAYIARSSLPSSPRTVIRRRPHRSVPETRRKKITIGADRLPTAGPCMLSPCFQFLLHLRPARRQIDLRRGLLLPPVLRRGCLGCLRRNPLCSSHPGRRHPAVIFHRG